MTAIIYLDNKPFYCFEFNRTSKDKISEILIESIIKVRVLNQEMILNILYFNCEIIHINYIIDHMKNSEFDISNHYKKTPGKITPIWFENVTGNR